LRELFEAVVHACMDAGLVKGEGFAVDASVIEADASRYHGKAPDEIDWSLPERQTRAVAEFLGAPDDEDLDTDRKLPKVISPVDPCSAWTAKANKRVQFGYGLNYLIDIKCAVIVDVEATPARGSAEARAAKTMLERTEATLALKPHRASKRACDRCLLKPRCCPKTPSRKVPRDVHEKERDVARALMGTPEYDKSRDERKKVEMRFAHLKTHHRFERMRLRGLSGARDEFHLAAIVQNLKTLGGYLQPPAPNVPAVCIA
jgi:hypothetical protein